MIIKQFFEANVINKPQSKVSILLKICLGQLYIQVQLNKILEQTELRFP